MALSGSSRPAGPEPLRMVRLMTADDGFAAKVVAARLGVEGIVWELRGGVDGPYPFGPVHVFVTQADLAEARAVLAASAPLGDLDGPGGDPGLDGFDGLYDGLDGMDDETEWDLGRIRRRRNRVVGAGVVGLLALASAELVRVLALRGGS